MRLSGIKCVWFCIWLATPPFPFSSFYLGEDHTLNWKEKEKKQEGKKATLHEIFPPARDEFMTKACGHAHEQRINARQDLQDI